MQRLDVTSSRNPTRRALTAPSMAINVIAASLAGMLLVMVLSQFPVVHYVDVGRYDAGYVRGFHDPERLDLPQARDYLIGSDGSARWTRAESYLLFPQAGLPARVMIRLRGWRSDGQPPRLSVLVDGREASIGVTTGEWQEIEVVLEHASLKPEDVLITLRTDAAPISAGDPRLAGVLVDAATYRTAGWPLQPYPAQLAWGALAGALLALTLADTRWSERKLWLRFFTPRRAWIAGMLLIGLAYLLLYRVQPVYPYPLRGLLPGVCSILGAIAAIRYGPKVTVRLPILPDALALAGIGVWVAAILAVAQDHVTLSVPGVEKDFRVFATRAVDLDLVFRADGFYHLGYPFLLWCVTPLTAGNPFLAARLIAACAGALFLVSSWWLARRVLGRGPALAALVMLALNPFVVQYALYIGSDMPFAALCTLTLALLAQLGDRRSVWRLALAGVIAGWAFLVRHPGILLLPLGIGVMLNVERSTFNVQRSMPGVLAFTGAFLIAIAPQVIVNMRDTGNPLYNQQAKNVWLAVYGDSDWGRWNEVSNDIPLTEVILADLARFAGAWWSNLRTFIGAGAETDADAGQASQLRLLAFPANWLAVIGIIGWLAIIGLRRHAADDRAEASFSLALPPVLLLLAWLALYTVALTVGLPLQRFFLPLTPVYAVAAAWTLQQTITVLTQRRAWDSSRLWVAGVLVLLLFLWQGFASGARDVLDRQPADETAIIRFIQQTLPSDAQLNAILTPGDPVGKYSAIAHRVVPPEQEARYLLHSAGAGPRPAGTIIATFGIYTLVQVAP